MFSFSGDKSLSSLFVGPCTRPPPHSLAVNLRGGGGTCIRHFQEQQIFRLRSATTGLSCPPSPSFLPPPPLHPPPSSPPSPTPPSRLPSLGLHLVWCLVDFRATPPVQTAGRPAVAVPFAAWEGAALQVVDAAQGVALGGEDGPNSLSGHVGGGCSRGRARRPGWVGAASLASWC